MTFTGTNDTTVATDSSLVTENKEEVTNIIGQINEKEVSRAMAFNPGSNREDMIDFLSAINAMNTMKEKGLTEMNYVSNIQIVSDKEVTNITPDPVPVVIISREELSKAMTLNPSATREEVIQALATTKVVNKVQDKGLKGPVSNSTDKDAECLAKLMPRLGASYEHFLKNEDIDVIKFMIRHKTCILTVSTFISCVEACKTNLSLIKILFEEISSILTFDKLKEKIEDYIYYNDHIVLLEYLLENGLITDLNTYLLRYCRSCYDYNEKMIKYLLSKGADVHVNDDICLQNACNNYDIKNMNLLLEHGAKFNTNTIEIVLKRDDTAMYQLMINSGVTIPKNNKYYINPTILEYMKRQEEQDKSMYYGVESTNKLDIKFPELLELEKNGKYYYVYKFTKTDDKFILDKEEIRKEIMKHLTKLFSLDTACSFYF